MNIFSSSSQVSGIWYLYAEHAKCGYTQSKTHLLESGKTVMHKYWTQKGRLFIYDLLKNRCGCLGRAPSKR